MIKPKDWLVFEYFIKKGLDYKLTNLVDCKLKEGHKAQLMYRGYECIYECEKCKVRYNVKEYIMHRFNKTEAKAKLAIKRVLSKLVPEVKLTYATNNIGKLMRAKVQAAMIGQQNKSIPCQLSLYLYAYDGNGNIINSTKAFTWKMKKHENSVVFDFIDNKSTIDKTKARLVHLKHFKDTFKKNYANAKSISHEIQIDKYYTIYEATIIDHQQFYADDNNKSNELGSLDIITFGKKLTPGITYEIDFVVAPNERKNNKIMGIAWSISDHASNIDKFIITKDIIESLDKFKGTDIETEWDKFQTLYGKPYLHKTLWFASALSFHSVIAFDYSGRKNCRGVVRLSLIGDTRTGKTEVCEGLIKQYRIGKKYNAALTTKGGFVGGSKQHGENGWSITPGALPNNHRGLIVLEEVQSANKDYYQSVREVKSSNVAKITRVSGEAEFQCIVRIIENSNPLSKIAGENKMVSNFKNGDTLIINNINLPEDIARQDLFVIIERGSGDDMVMATIPDNSKYKDFTPQDFNNKIMWVWSRHRKHIIISEEVARYNFEKGKYMHTHWHSKSGLFNAEIDQKLMRWAVAYAAMVVSTDKTYENIIVKKEHIDIVYKHLFVENYFSKTFNMDNVLDEFNKRHIFTPENERILEQMIDLSPNFVNYVVDNQEASYSAFELSKLLVVDWDNPRNDNLVGAMTANYFFEQIPNGKFKFARKLIQACKDRING